MNIAVTIPAPAIEPNDRRPDSCGRCGAKTFNVHQHATKSVKDPARLQAPIIRYICKGCRKTTRLYPDGVDAARQTVALRQASVMLYWLGLSYDGIRDYLDHLGCPLSKATVWANVRASGMLGSRHRLRADAGSLVTQPRPDGAAARFLLNGREVTVRLSCAVPDELVIWAGALQPETARLVHRRAVEAARRLGLRAETLEIVEAARA